MLGQAEQVCELTQWNPGLAQVVQCGLLARFLANGLESHVLCCQMALQGAWMDRKQTCDICLVALRCAEGATHRLPNTGRNAFARILKVPGDIVFRDLPQHGFAPRRSARKVSRLTCSAARGCSVNTDDAKETPIGGDWHHRRMRQRDRTQLVLRPHQKLGDAVQVAQAQIDRLARHRQLGQTDLRRHLRGGRGTTAMHQYARKEH